MKKLTQTLLWLMAILIAVPASAATFVGDRTDFRDETIYFAMTTRFYDGDPKNNVLSWDKQAQQMQYNDPDWRGDFAGLIEKLDYIKALGFTAIWITPIVQNASGEDYHGYHAMDMSSVDIRYESRTQWGSAKDVKFQDLINAAHAKGMKIILDVVLQHTGNFGEVNLNPLFTRSQDIRNQASVKHSMIPNYDRLPSNYNELGGNAQYQARFKYFKNPEFEPNNYYHHYGTGWNWDLPNRWWAQIAGDCVDLNTENDYVAQYIVNCYSKFIEMGVDGFRIDTSGHIAPLTFNKQFIPQFLAAGERAKDKRLNGAPFFMFGEVCQRFQGSVVYRDQPNLSSYFYTWKSSESLLNQYNGSAEWWRQQVLPEGHDTPVGPMAVCEQDTQDKPRSQNAWMQNGQWHEPDYSQYSGFSVIDFPMHYSFSNAASAIAYAGQDNYYNDATFNVVYVDSHDYSPGPNDGVRFNGGTAQWAENLSLMFTFRGIPCIYYGSEVEFMKGKPIDTGGENGGPRSESGRAYFGHYIEGDITATDFGQFSATGHAATTLNGDLAQHIIRLNQIRAAVPALRKGQYTFDGCKANGGWAFKRAYKNESYALVAINGGATFSNVPAGTYTDIVTGQTFTPSNGTITVTAPSTKGQLRVLVKDWTGGKVGSDGKFIYTTSAVDKGGNPSFTDPGTTEYYTAEDAVGSAEVKFSPAGGSFKTETLSVTATLNETAASGWYKIGDNARVDMAKGSTKTFTIGSGMSFGETVTVSWGATDDNGETFTGSVRYKKVDPNATITVYAKAPAGTNLYAWGPNGDGVETKFCGEWPGKALSETTNINGTDYYFVTFDDAESVNIIFNRSGKQTADIKGITEDTFFEYDGETTAKKIDVNVTPVPSVSFSPNGGNFTETVTVTATAKNATSASYSINGGAAVSINGTATFTLGDAYAYDTPITVSWTATNGTETKTGSVKFTRKEQGAAPEYYVYLKNTANWSQPYVWAWDGSTNCTASGSWPGDMMTREGNLWKWELPAGKTVPTNIIFNSGSDSNKTGDLKFVSGATYDCSGRIIENGSDEPIPSGFMVYYDNSSTGWSQPYVHYWGGDSSTGWPGVPMNLIEGNIWGYEVANGTTGLVFHNNSGHQSGDLTAKPNGLYTLDGQNGEYGGVDQITVDDANGEVFYYNMQGIQVDTPQKGIYIRRQGSRTEKIIVR